MQKLYEAREISACHRAFEFTQVDEHILKIDFKPTNECISNAKRNANFGDRFVFDIHVIKVNCLRCCNDEAHSEVGRYYVCGQFEYCKISHYPTVIDFGEVVYNKKITKVIHIRNDSRHVTSVIEYAKVTGIDVMPSKLIMLPNTKKKMCISLRPPSLNVANQIVIKISNENKSIGSNNYNSNYNFIPYEITIVSNIHFEKKPDDTVIESLHKLYDKNPMYTYIGDELMLTYKRKLLAQTFLRSHIKSKLKKPLMKFAAIKDKNQCLNDLPLTKDQSATNFCKQSRKHITIYDLFDIIFYPPVLNFGRVTILSHGVQELKIKNNSKYEVKLKLLKDECITYTDNQNATLTIKMKSLTEQIVMIHCFGYVEGSYRGTFNYVIENKYYLQHQYSLQVGNPTLVVKDKNIKFGMVTLENFITSIPVRIYNYFNTSVNFEWEEPQVDVPFIVVPNSGLVPSQSCRICDVQYVCKPTKSKMHEIELVSCGKINKIIPVELNLVTRKLSIKFLETAIVFKDIPLNLEVIENVKLENSSREFAVFHVLETLIPGITISPMNGIIKPKTILIFTIKVQISCVVEISFDLNLKINNKETIILPVSGNVVEPRIIIHPKNIYMARVPCYMITYVPVVIQNAGKVKTLIQVIDTNDDNIFGVYISNGNEKQKVSEFFIAGGQSRTVFIKVYDIFRREYDIFLPFQINKLLGPPDKNVWTTELQYYISKYEKYVL